MQIYMQAKLSIITVVYNGVELLDGTIQSVLNQSYPNIEYLIIDGNSNDGTQNIIKRYENDIDFWLSEPDKGLYDAMNKGLSHATGDYVWFMNCGDQIYASDTVSKVFASHPNAGIYYGECMFVNDERKELGLRSELTPHQLPTSLNWKSLNRGMVVSHQSFIPKRSLSSMYIDNNLCADIEWVIEILKKSKHNQYVDLVLSQFLIGGVSRTRHRESLKNRYQVLAKQYGYIPNIINHLRIIGRSIYHKYFRRRGDMTY